MAKNMDEMQDDVEESLDEDLKDEIRLEVELTSWRHDQGHFLTTAIKLPENFNPRESFNSSIQDDPDFYLNEIDPLIEKISIDYGKLKYVGSYEGLKWVTNKATVELWNRLLDDLEGLGFVFDGRHIPSIPEHLLSPWDRMKK